MSTMKTFGTAKAITMASALAVALGTATPVVASASTPQRPASVAAGTALPASDAGGCATAASTTKPTTDMTLLHGERAQALTDAVGAAVRSGEISTSAPSGALALDRAKVYEVSSADSTHTSVTVPVAGDFSKTSNLTVVFDSQGRVVQSGETLVTRNAAGHFAISAYADGSLVRTTDTGRPYLTNAQLDALDAKASPQADTQAQAKGTGSTVACVAAVLGVSGATAYLIVGACAGACTIPIAGTAICVACIGAYAAVGGASITAVASCF